MAKKKTEGHIVTLVASLPDGTNIIEHPDGSLERRRSQTDWAALDAMTDEQIEEAVRNDPDWREFEKLDWSDVVLVAPPKKQPISIRVDEDVLNFFKEEGPGYQRRMNTVLRSYMRQKKSKKKGR